MRSSHTINIATTITYFNQVEEPVCDSVPREKCGLVPREQCQEVNIVVVIEVDTR